MQQAIYIKHKTEIHVFQEEVSRRSFKKILDNTVS